jgi:hypothetical protein
MWNGYGNGAKPIPAIGGVAGGGRGVMRYKIQLRYKI